MLNLILEQVEPILKIKLAFMIVSGWTLLVEISFHMRSGDSTHPNTNNQRQPIKLYDAYIHMR